MRKLLKMNRECTLSISRTIGIADDMTFSNILSANFRATYVRYTRVEKMLIKYKIVLHLLVDLFKDVSAARNLLIAYFEYRSLYILSGEHIFVMI